MSDGWKTWLQEAREILEEAQEVWNEIQEIKEELQEIYEARPREEVPHAPTPACSSQDDC